MYFSFLFLQKVYRIGFLFVLLFFVFDIIAFFYYPDTIFGDIFLATREQTPLTWLSALSLFFIAISSFSIYFETKNKSWYFLAVTFFFFSMDDAVYLHERISGFFVDHSEIFGAFPTYIWAFLYAPLLLSSLGMLVFFLWRDADKKTRNILIMAMCLLAFAITLDLVDGLIQKNTDLVFCFDAFCDMTITHLIRLSEEVIEVLALGLLGYVNIREHLLLKNDGHNQKK